MNTLNTTDHLDIGVNRYEQIKSSHPRFMVYQVRRILHKVLKITVCFMW